MTACRIRMTLTAFQLAFLLIGESWAAMVAMMPKILSREGEAAAAAAALAEVTTVTGGVAQCIVAHYLN
jgi:hypothetical protein